MKRLNALSEEETDASKDHIQEVCTKILQVLKQAGERAQPGGMRSIQDMILMSPEEISGNLPTQGTICYSIQFELNFLIKRKIGNTSHSSHKQYVADSSSSMANMSHQDPQRRENK